MPVEIKELVIRTVVETGEAAPSSMEDDGAVTPNGQGRLDSQDAQAIVEECVRQVLWIIDRRRER